LVFASAVAAWTLRESFIVFVFGKSGWEDKCGVSGDGGWMAKVPLLH
jgi:hypothetical protein